jgi:hypothetical protein
MAFLPVIIIAVVIAGRGTSDVPRKGSAGRFAVCTIQVCDVKVNTLRKAE